VQLVAASSPALTCNSRCYPDWLFQKDIYNMVYIPYNNQQSILQRRDDLQEFDVEFYDKADGSKPAKEFIVELPPKMRAKMLRTVDMLETNGSELREPCSKHLDDGIFELRAQIGSDISRVLYFFVIGRKAVLTHGFVKKTQKTPPSEIERAKNYRTDYLSRKENQK